LWLRRPTKAFLWLELLEETETLSTEKLREIKREARELAAIFSASQKTAKANR